MPSNEWEILFSSVTQPSKTAAEPSSTPSAYYSAEVEEFLAASPAQILGSMASRGQFLLELEQRNAWEVQTSVLQASLVGLSGRVLLSETSCNCFNSFQDQSLVAAGPQSIRLAGHR